MGSLLLRRARRDGAPPLESVGLRSAQHDDEVAAVPCGAAPRARASARRRAVAQAMSPRSAAWHAAGKSLHLLWTPCLGHSVQARSLLRHVLAVSPCAQACLARHPGWFGHRNDAGTAGGVPG